MDFLWRRDVAKIVAARKPSAVLDLATGSGDLAIALQSRCPEATVIGADFCLPMLEEARKKHFPLLVQADALALPFAVESFDVVTIAFGLRNMASWEKAAAECARVLRPGGLLLVLDFALPRSPVFRSIYRIYLHHVLPRIAGWTTGRPEAYEYLGESIESFPRWERMNALLDAGGFTCARPKAYCAGIVALYQATRSNPPAERNSAKSAA